MNHVCRPRITIIYSRYPGTSWCTHLCVCVKRCLVDSSERFGRSRNFTSVIDNFGLS